MTAGYMGSYKGTTGPVMDTAQEAADAFFSVYRTYRNCHTHYVRIIGETGLVSRDYAVMSFAWKRAKGHAVNAIN